MLKIESSQKITILSLSWRDLAAPKAGGAEVHTHEMLKRLDQNRYRVYHISMGNPKVPEVEVVDGVTYIRHGNPATVILYAMNWYRRNRKRIDFVIDQCNTHRFFTPLWVKSEKRIFYIHQLTKEIWDISAKPPLSTIGKRMEDRFLRLNRKDYVITVSDSTKEELIERGYQNDRIRIIHNGVSFVPWKEEEWCEKEKDPTFIYVGRYAPYKGINVSVEALARIKKDFPNAKLWIMGKKDQAYVDEFLMPILQANGMSFEDAVNDHPTGDVISWGFVSEEKKLELLSRAWVLLFPSIREGWGIPVTEAGCVGTPCIAFDSPGLRDAVDHGNAGFLCKDKTAEGLAKEMSVAISDKMLYSSKRAKAYAFSSQFLWDEVGLELDCFLKEIKKECE